MLHISSSLSQSTWLYIHVDVQEVNENNGTKNEHSDNISRANLIVRQKNIKATNLPENCNHAQRNPLEFL